MRYITLVLLFILLPSVGQAEKIVPTTSETTKITFDVIFYDTARDLRNALREVGFKDYRGTRGISICQDGYCTIWTVRPTKVDDDATLTLGHEVLHGIYGEYHK